MTGPGADPALGAKAIGAGYRLAAFETIGSTNSEGLARGRSGDPGRLWLVAGEQTAGRGRRGRAWSSRRGNLAASLLLMSDAPATAVATLGFAAGVALVTALDGLLPEGARGRVALKWPNDVVADRKKLAGILLEAEPAGPGRLAVVVGIGVNVVSAPDDLAYPATAVAALGGAPSAAALFAGLSDAWVDAERLWDGGAGLDRLRRAWLARAHGLGAPASVRVGSRHVTGVFETLDEECRLVIRQADGRRETVAAGEVHFGEAASVPVDPGVAPG
ncbi:biotin--[acetyl-CoA-carboxylase] ligase [Prosthecomicrobium sp. N25]|uniref:biotin--[acetyl-CoA-carboxylase] ligase n=1 Tax=Prosthecomicrobium sp. N25 TaxID=3129254 RepID=UPI003076B036